MISRRVTARAFFDRHRDANLTKLFSRTNTVGRTIGVQQAAPQVVCPVRQVQVGVGRVGVRDVLRLGGGESEGRTP